MRAGVSIRTESLSKRYRLGEARRAYGTLREAIVEAVRAPFSRRAASGRSEEVWALRDLELEIPTGDVVGIVGSNGAGKSTLLKIVSRITEPTSGRASVRGRVGSLLEVGTGFHPELTGRENVFLYGAILGMRRGEIRARFDDIIAFAEVDRFIDTPVKRYSTGMHTRLAFSVAAHLEPEVLLVDEVLAVGDAAFQRKCLAKMQAVAGEGRTVLFVSHNMAAVRNLCRSVAVLERGRLLFFGPAAEGLASYARSVHEAALPTRLDDLPRKGEGGVRLLETRLRSGGRVETHHVAGLPFEIAFRYETAPELAGAMLNVQVRFLDAQGVTLLTLWNKLLPDGPNAYPPRGWLVFAVDRFPLRPGPYRLSAWVKSHRGVEDALDAQIPFEVTEGDFFGSGAEPPPDVGVYYVDHRFSVEAEGGRWGG